MSKPQTPRFRPPASSRRFLFLRNFFKYPTMLGSGIPYSTIPAAVRWEILQESRQLLQPEGALLVYQFTSTVLPYLKSSFSSVQQNFQFLNVMPARIFYCTP